jgi:hypothetical protein
MAHSFFATDKIFSFCHFDIQEKTTTPLPLGSLLQLFVFFVTRYKEVTLFCGRLSREYREKSKIPSSSIEEVFVHYHSEVP